MSTLVRNTLQICFVYDFFRSIHDNGTAARNGRWLYDLLSPGLVQLGHDIRWMDAGEPSVERGIATLLGAAAGWRGTDAWVAAFSAPETREIVAQASAPLRHFELVIGFELSPNQIRALCSEGIPFLDVSIDPIRFGPDIFFRMRTNDDALLQMLDAHEIGLETLRPYASLLRSKVGRSLRQPDAHAPAILFAGQTDVDASLISGARLARAACYTAELRQALAQGQQLLLKPHPGGQAHQDILGLGAAFPAARLINDNIYALLCAPWIERVITLSSSVAQEAELFDKPATCLAQPDNTQSRIGADLVSRDFRIGLDALQPGFWQALRPVGHAAAIHSAQPVAGNLRQALGEAWGYTNAPEFLDRTVAAGQTLSFETGGNGLRLCAFGWSHPEPTGIWSVGPLTTLLIDTDGAALDITLACTAFLSGSLHPRGMTIQARPANEPEQTIVFFTPFSKHIRLRLPAIRGLTEIMFTFPAGLATPAAAGGSRDQRPLGIKLQRIVVTHRGQAAPRAPRQGGAAAALGKTARFAASVVAAAVGLS
jgi:hypothetical protein